MMKVLVWLFVVTFSTDDKDWSLTFEHRSVQSCRAAQKNMGISELPPGVTFTTNCFLVPSTSQGL